MWHSGQVEYNHQAYIIWYHSWRGSSSSWRRRMLLLICYWNETTTCHKYSHKRLFLLQLWLLLRRNSAAVSPSRTSFGTRIKGFCWQVSCVLMPAPSGQVSLNWGVWRGPLHIPNVLFFIKKSRHVPSATTKHENFKWRSLVPVHFCKGERYGGWLAADDVCWSQSTPHVKQKSG